MINAQHTIGVSDETRQLLEEFKYTHAEKIRLFRTSDDGRIRHDDIICYALNRVKELEKQEAIRKAKEQTAEILKEGESEGNAQNNNLQERKNNIL